MFCNFKNKKILRNRKYNLNFIFYFLNAFRVGIEKIFGIFRLFYNNDPKNAIEANTGFLA